MARVQHHKVRVRVGWANRYVVPKEIVVFEFFLQSFRETTFARGGKFARAGCRDECCHGLCLPRNFLTSGRFGKRRCALVNRIAYASSSNSVTLPTQPLRSPYDFGTVLVSTSPWINYGSALQALVTRIQLFGCTGVRQRNTDSLLPTFDTHPFILQYLRPPQTGNPCWISRSLLLQLSVSLHPSLPRRMYSVCNLKSCYRSAHALAPQRERL